MMALALLLTGPIYESAGPGRGAGRGDMAYVIDRFLPLFDEPLFL